MRHLAQRRRPSPAMVVALVALVLAFSSSAVADPIAGAAASVFRTAKQALGLAKKADKRSKQALRIANDARRTGGPQGPPGPPGLTGPQGERGLQGVSGSDAQFDGAAAGGDLAGSYPDPVIGPDAIDGAEVAPNALGGGHILESSLGTVPSATNAANASSLGGVASADYQRRCAANGVVFHARLRGDAAGFPSTFTSSTAYIDRVFHCIPGATVQASRDATGAYSIFLNTGGSTNINDPYPNLIFATVDSFGSNDVTNDNFTSIYRGALNLFRVRTYDDDSGPQDATVNVIGIFG
jgi:hypothetical protein